MPRITQQQLEAMLWGAANVLRGRTAGQDYKGYVLSLLFFKRLSDQWDHEADALVAQKEAERGKPFTEAQRKALIAQGGHRFTIPDGCHWGDVLKQATNIGEALDRALQGIQSANRELSGVFTARWNLPAPDGDGKLIGNEVVHELVQRFNDIPLSNAHVTADMLGRAYEYLIKMFADDAGAKAGEFFTPPEVVDCLVRILRPASDQTVYDPTCGSGGMLIHAHDYLKEQGEKPAMQIRYHGQEMVWTTFAIAKINSILHGMEADIRGGKSTITDPQHLNSDGSLRQFDVVLSNFPFSDEMWWLSEDARARAESQKAEEKATGKKKSGKKSAKASRDDFTDKFSRFVFGTPPAGYGDYAFIQHIIASLLPGGRAGVVCPQGVLFRGQPEIEEETGEFDEDGNPKIRRRKADDEYLIRKGLLDARLIDAVIALPLNVFYGAGVPACLFIIDKNRPKARRDKVLLVYAARHYRELSNKNQLRPQDVMRILVHYHAYGDAKKAAALVKEHSQRLRDEITREEHEEIERITAEFEEDANRLASLQADLAKEQKALAAATAAKTKMADLARFEATVARIEKAIERPKAKVAQRDERIAEQRKRAEEDRQAVVTAGKELVAMYADPAELAKHARVAEMSEIEENEHNLNIPRYVDTFEPEEPIDVREALKALDEAERQRAAADGELRRLLAEVGYAP
ncbi:MAG: N-6 DNA methylase [Phycisphaerales bacterium]|nr:N-6 DNA methylase [Phycisphaerales bacterium]